LKSTFVGSSDPIQAFIEQIYKNARCHLFHAKHGENFFSPHSRIETHQTVAEALNKLTRIFLLLVQEENNSARGLGASMSTGLEKALMAPLLKNSFFILSDDDSPFDPDEKGFDNPRYKHVIKSEKVTENASNTHKFALIGNIRNIESGGLSQIRRIELNEIDVMEIQINHQLISAKSVKKQFVM
jgi:hypothetical protein